MRHAFMPGKFVFPGGRTDPGDSRIAAATPLHDEVAAKMAAGLGARASAARCRAIAMSAVRETYEEAGLLIGAPPPEAGRRLPNTDWRRRLAGCAPLPAPLPRPDGCAGSTHGFSPPSARRSPGNCPKAGPAANWKMWSG